MVSLLKTYFVELNKLYNIAKDITFCLYGLKLPNSYVNISFNSKMYKTSLGI